MKKPIFHPRALARICVLALTFAIIGSGPAGAIDFIWEGENYRNVKVVAVSGDEVTLESSKGEKIDVPKKSLVGLLLKDAEAMAESQGKAQEEAERAAQEEADARFLKRPKRKVRRRGPFVAEQDRMERAWIHGTAQAGTADGFVVLSSSNSLPRGKPRRDGSVAEPKMSKDGAEIYQGQVFVKGSRGPGFNEVYEGVLWRDGFVQDGPGRIPAFSTRKPELEVPELSIDRKWTSADADKRHMQATLIGLAGDKAQFLNTKGEEFPLQLSALSEADQEFIKESAAKHAEELEKFLLDHPWVKPELEVPELSIDRKWTSADKRHMQATLIGLEGEQAQFLNTKGKEFPLELSALSEADQEFIKEAAAKHAQELEQFLLDHPWVKLE